MKKFFFVLLVVVSCQNEPAELTTFILVRHAEKVADGSKDPALTQEGEARANRLLSLFEEAKISAIYSTNYIRTQKTVQPLADKKGLEIKAYDWENPVQMLEGMIIEHGGGIIMISGHSNTTPVLANLLLGDEAYSQFDDSDYSNLIIITTTEVGKGQVTHLRF